MCDYRVVWSREAIYDVADMADYIKLRFGWERADQFNDAIDVEGEALGHNFRMYAGTGIFYRSQLILKKLVEPSISLPMLRVVRKRLISSGFSVMKETGRRYSGKQSAIRLINLLLSPVTPPRRFCGSYEW